MWFNPLSSASDIISRDDDRVKCRLHVITAITQLTRLNDGDNDTTDVVNLFKLSGIYVSLDILGMDDNFLD